MKKNSSNKSAKSAKVAEKSAKQLPTAQLPAPQLPAKVISPAAAIYHARREAGVCVKCGQPTAEGSNLLCTAHLEYYNKWHAAKKAKIDAAMALLAKAEAAPVVVPAAPAKTAKTAKTAKK